MNDFLTTDVLIIGCGIAGCNAALTLADAGVQVTVITRARRPEESNTYYAQGGIIYQGFQDSPDLLAEDILRAGAGHCNPRAVQILAQEGAGAVRRILLERVGVQFDQEADGALSLALEGGHSLPRIIHATDATGKAIELALLHAVDRHPNVTLLIGHTAVDLLTPSHHGLNPLAVYEPRSCVGAYVLNHEQGRILLLLSQTTVLASAGLHQLFLRTPH
ncbi:L-aspartate oxidase, partial [Litorilinea aerophila]